MADSYWSNLSLTNPTTWFGGMTGNAMNALDANKNLINKRAKELGFVDTSNPEVNKMSMFPPAVGATASALFGPTAASLYGIGSMAENQGNAMMGNYNLANQNNLNLEDYITLDGTNPVVNEGQLLSDTNYFGAPTNIQYPGGNPIYPRQVYQDRIMDPNLMRIAQERGNIDNRGFKFPSILGAVKGGIEFLGDKFGMTQVSPEDRAANEQFMTEQGIGIDNTGRMVGGDFAGKIAAGDSGWGSANFGEMAQKWDEEYGDMDYRTPKMIAKQKRIKAQAAAYAQKLAADNKAAHDAQMAKSGITVTGGGYQGGGDRGRGGQGAFKEDVTSMRSAGRSYTDAQGNTGYSRGRKDGGRIGYREGLLVDEDVNIEGPGFDINENVMMASDPTINAELYGLYLDALDSNKIPADTTFEMFKDLMTQAQSQDQGIASMV